MVKFAWLLVAGALGAFSRYAFAGLVQRHASAAFPFGTLAVNLVGCLLAGLLLEVMERQVTIAPEIRTALMVGFMGAFTTFSTYMVETAALLREGEWAFASLNFAAHNLGGFAALLIGTALARLL
jgi:CrcB protein